MRYSIIKLTSGKNYFYFYPAMSILREIPPTAGLPLYLTDLLFALHPKSHSGSLENDFKNYLGVAYARVTYSGTAAFYLILESLKELSRKKTVIIPSFICPLVPLAIKRAGLKVEVCDIGAEGFNFNLHELEKLCASNGDILAIIPTHLAGIPIEFTAIEQIAKKQGVFIVEDCAQSLGAVYKGEKVGTRGDFAFFSLCRGKGLTIYEGGVIVTNKEEYARVIECKIRELVKDDFFSEGIKILELLGYALLYRPFLFWFIFRLPQLFWNLQGQPLRANIEYFEQNFPLHRVSGIRKLLGHLGFSRLEEAIKKQREKASIYIAGLREIPGIEIIEELPGTRATYPYLTAVFNDPKKRNQAKQIFENSGLGVSQIYALAITDYDYLKPILPEKICPRARSLAERHLTLSTNTFLKERDLGRIIAMLKNL